MASATTQDVMTLHTLLQDKPWNMALKKGEITSPILKFDFDDVEEASDHFKPFVRQLAYDCGELAICTYLQAKAYNKPLSLLPFVVSGNFHHKSIAYNVKKLGEMTPAQLGGKTVGVRTYSQTTGVWVRGVLQNDYGADLDKCKFLVFDEAHLSEHTDPPNVSRAPAGKKLAAMLLEGEIDAGMLGGNMPKDDRLKTVIPNPDQAAKEWSKKHGGITPINHMFVVQTSIVKSRPDVVKEIYRMLTENRARVPAPPPDGPQTPNGIEANRKSLELVIKYAYQQHVIPRMFTVDELFEDTAKIIGA